MTLALGKGRASSSLLMPACRSLFVHSILCDVTIVARWIASELNPADYASRHFDDAMSSEAAKASRAARWTGGRQQLADALERAIAAEAERRVAPRGEAPYTRELAADVADQQPAPVKAGALGQEAEAHGSLCKRRCQRQGQCCLSGLSKPRARCRKG